MGTRRQPRALRGAADAHAQRLGVALQTPADWQRDDSWTVSIAAHIARCFPIDIGMSPWSDAEKYPDFRRTRRLVRLNS